MSIGQTVEPSCFVSTQKASRGPPRVPVRTWARTDRRFTLLASRGLFSYMVLIMLGHWQLVDHCGEVERKASTRCRSQSIFVSGVGVPPGICAGIHPGGGASEPKKSRWKPNNGFRPVALDSLCYGSFVDHAGIPMYLLSLMLISRRNAM